MPGPSRWRTVTVSHAVNSGKINEKLVDARVRNVLEAIKRAERSGIPEGFQETTRHKKADRLLLRRSAADSIVLLKNDDNILPLKTSLTVCRLLSVVKSEYTDCQDRCYRFECKGCDILWRW